MTILIITLGGTIGAKAYANPRLPPKFITPVTNGNPVAEAIPEHLDFRIVALPPVDSQKINGPYLNRLIHELTHAPEQKIMISVGTDGMLRVAKTLQRRRHSEKTLREKHIVLTGAMIPLRYGIKSDGTTNLDYTLALLSGNVPASHLREIGRAGIGIVLSAYGAKPEPFVHHPHFATKRKQHFVPCLYPGAFHALAKQRDRGNGHRNRLVAKHRLVFDR